jgi:hypothetical protein
MSRVAMRLEAPPIKRQGFLYALIEILAGVTIQCNYGVDHNEQLVARGPLPWPTPMGSSPIGQIQRQPFIINKHHAQRTSRLLCLLI